MLEEIQITNSDQLSNIVGKLSAMRLNREIKLISGSFDLGVFVHAKFREKRTGQLWELRCVNDNHGGGYLKKI